MIVFVEDINKNIDLPPNCVSGGEGDVYIKDGFAYKIYHDINKALSKQKFEELKQLDRPNIIKPESLLYDNQHNIIGYKMKAVSKCYSLSRLVTNDFRTQHNISNEMIYKLIQKMRETIEFIHQKKCLIVDGNEMNYLVDEKFEEVYFIDVDSYQTKNFKANAYSPSTLDPLVEAKQKFTIESDWFAFGIITCSLLVGIHPFKGTYKGISLNIKKGDIKSRMENKRSIFNDKVAVNSAVRNFSLIPSHYLDWFKSLFENEKRFQAPLNIFDIKTISNEIFKNIIFDETIKSIELFQHKSAILEFIKFDDYTFLKDRSNFINLKIKENYKYKNEKTELLFINNIPHLIKSDGYITLFNLETKTVIDTEVKSDNCFVIDNRIYSIYNSKLQELKFIMNKLMITNNWEVIENSFDLFKNVCVQKISNRNIFYIPYMTESCAIINMKEMENKKIVNAFYKNRMLEVVYYENGIYKRSIIKINTNLKDYIIIHNEETDDLSINAITLNNGVFLSIFNDKEIFMTLNKYEKNTINIVKDKNIEITNKLYNYNNDVYMIIDNKISKISLS